MSESLDPELVERLVREEKILESRVIAVLTAVKEGATVPFLARYRKELTGGLDEVRLRELIESSERIQAFLDRREVILASLRDSGVLNDELMNAFAAATTKQELEDLYLPYKPKRKTKASEAIARGLEPLALMILEQPKAGDPEKEALAFVSAERGVPDTAAALTGAKDIAVERISTEPNLRQALRAIFEEHGQIVSKKVEEKQEERTPYDDWADYSEPFATIASHRVHAMLRGEKDGVLDVKLQLERERVLDWMERRLELNPRSNWSSHLRTALTEAWTARLSRSLPIEVLAARKVKADEDAARIFGENLHHLLLQAPFGARPVLGIDPGYRSGCKAAVVDATGRYRESLLLHPHLGASAAEQSARALKALLQRFQVDAIAVGDGTAGRETEQFVRAALDGTPFAGIPVVSVSEAGASVYSASELAREEFPELDLTIRGAISIARRLQDPLAELVKVEPRAIGVGQYQHDVEPSLLDARLHAVVETCVNRVGVDLDTASAPLLAEVAGIGHKLARSIVQHREASGPFQSRHDLLEVKGLGPKTFEQAAGFLRVRHGKDPLDRTAVHPERYPVVRRIAQDLKISLDDLLGREDLLKSLDLSRYVEGDLGLPTLEDIRRELLQPGRDPRADFRAPAFRQDIRAIEDLLPGMELEGKVLNVTAFGAFVDLGLKEAGLVHKSALWRRVREPSELLHVGQILKVVVEKVEPERGRIGLKALAPEPAPGARR